MIKVIKVNRKKILLGFLALLGLACCIVGFSGAAQKIAGSFSNSDPASVSISQPELPQNPSLAGDENSEGTLDQSPGQAAEDLQEVRETQSDISDPEAFFVEYRMDRERARGKQVELLREVMASSSIDEETRKTAHEKFLSISSSISKEMELENLLRARGFQDAAVFLDGDSVTVVVQPGQTEVVADDNTDLTQLVAKSTGVTEENVIIITKDF